jgi:hypothetical protein
MRGEGLCDIVRMQVGRGHAVARVEQRAGDGKAHAGVGTGD